MSDQQGRGRPVLISRSWGPGPVFAYEWLTSSRRWQIYAGRAAFVALILGALTCVWWAQVAGRTLATIDDQARVGQSFFRAIVLTQIVMVLIAAPAATAGGFCQEKGSGNLLLLLITDLSDAEIVLSKLAARLVSILGVTCCAVPVLALGALLGGIDPLALAGSFLVTVGLTVLGCTIALTFSVWGTKPYEVLLATYAVLTVWLLAMPVWEFFAWLRGIPRFPDWMLATNPVLLAFAPYERPGKVSLADFVGFAAGALAISAALVVLAIGRMRAVTVRQAGGPTGRRPGRGGWRWPVGGTRSGDLAGPPLDRNPMLWYEWHRKRPSPWIGALIRLYHVLAIGFSALAIDDCLRPRTPIPGWLPAIVNAFLVVFGLPLMLIAATTSMVEERVRGSLDVLLATPLSTTSIVLAKWWSVFARLPRLLLLPVWVAVMLSLTRGDWPLAVLFVAYVVAAAAAWTSVGLALSTWIPRLGRAVSTAVGIYIFVSIGWPALAFTLFQNRSFGTVGNALAMISPFYGSFDLTISIEIIDHIYFWGLTWTTAQAMVAVVMLLATLATFDRSFGRVRDHRGRHASRDQ